MTDHDWMGVAIEIGRMGVETGQAPFGAAIVRQGELIASAHNSVWRDHDPTAHAEVNAIRFASRKLQSEDLSGCVLYSTCEPCPMCLASTHWAQIECVYFGAQIADSKALGFAELEIPATEMVRQGKSPLKVVGGLRTVDCRALFDFFIYKQKTG